MDIAAFSIIFIVLMLLIYIPVLALLVCQYIAMWKILRKMDRPGWWIFVPFAALFIFYDRSWKRGAFWRYLAYAAVYMISYFVLMFSVIFQTVSYSANGMDTYAPIGTALILLVLIIIAAVLMIVNLVRMYIHLAKAFGKSAGFGWGLAFLAPIFLMILGFGNAQYIGNTTYASQMQYAPPQEQYIPPQN